LKKNLSNLFNLSGKTALVTGGTGLQGKRIGRGLAANGANVALVGCLMTLETQARLLSNYLKL
tara:strand:- start:57 stop:245 length:189 start_codon:yes stop_codon:yes gene_type:complete